MYFPWQVLIFVVIGDVEWCFFNPSKNDRHEYSREDNHQHQTDPIIPELSPRAVNQVREHFTEGRHVDLKCLEPVVTLVGLSWIGGEHGNRQMNT